MSKFLEGQDGDALNAQLPRFRLPVKDPFPSPFLGLYADRKQLEVPRSRAALVTPICRPLHPTYLNLESKLVSDSEAWYRFDLGRSNEEVGAFWEPAKITALCLDRWCRNGSQDRKYWVS
jgi:hypothetical protein